VNVLYDTAKNGFIWCNISGSTGLIFAIFTPSESALRANDGSIAFFPICQGTLPWQPNNVAKMYQRRLIPLAFGALVIENELQYHDIVVHNISAYDACISCKNYREICPVTPELTAAHL